MNHRLAALVALSATSLFSCTPTPENSNKPKEPNKKMAKATGTSLDQLRGGYGVYMTQCYQCHAQPDPTTFSEQQWKDIVPVMGNHAGLPDKDRDMVLKYLLARRQQQ